MNGKAAAGRIRGHPDHFLNHGIQCPAIREAIHLDPAPVQRNAPLRIGREAVQADLQIIQPVEYIPERERPVTLDGPLITGFSLPT